MTPAAGRRERVLIVDDEPLVLEMLRMVLQSSGYRVEAFASPEDALEFYRRETSAFDLAVLDLSLPFYSGVELAAALRISKPRLPIVFMSGYGRPTTFGSTVETRSAAFVHKPFDSSELLLAIRTLLANTVGVDDSNQIG